MPHIEADTTTGRLWEKEIYRGEGEQEGVKTEPNGYGVRQAVRGTVGAREAEQGGGGSKAIS